MEMSSYTGQTFEELKAAGYARVSNRHRILARLEPNWRMRRIGHGPVPVEDTPDNQDFYRRVHSKDWVENVPDALYKKFPASREYWHHEE